MKIAVYSDLHLEYGNNYCIPDKDCDLVILAGDIINFGEYRPLAKFLNAIARPVLYVPGNHEYYRSGSIVQAEKAVSTWLASEFPFCHLLLDESINIGGINFFGGTMWTDFNNGNVEAMAIAQKEMSDYTAITLSENKQITPADTIVLHKSFMMKLMDWLEQDLSGPRVIITHHAPILKPNSCFISSGLEPAFIASGTKKLIKRFSPDLWIYGHTHECDDHKFSGTRIISNPRGNSEDCGGTFQCSSFSEEGYPIQIE